MSRQLKFRGRKSNGEWVFGSLIQMSKDSSQCFIFPFYNYASSLSCSQIVAMDMVAVDPETIGQYTGMKNKKGTMIFEGDICEFRSFNCRRVGVVIFNEEKYRFELLQSGDADWSLEIHEVFDLEVIGNIHDNPELMEV